MKTAPKIPDFCPSCDATDKPFDLVERKSVQEFRGDTFEVSSLAYACRHCGFGLLGPGHLDALRVATHDAYRRRHGLLTSAEIVARRKAMAISQRRFAEFLGVGSASIERWEAGTLVQDKASDLLLRQRTETALYLPATLSHAPTASATFSFKAPLAPAFTASAEHSRGKASADENRTSNPITTYSDALTTAA